MSTPAASLEASELPALVARGVSKSFGATPALTDAALSVGRGTIHALLGGNGSGKSTLIKCLAGVYQADAGDIEIRGESVTAAAMTPALARRLRLGFVHQDLGLFPGLSIAENVALYGGYPVARGISAVRWKQLDARVAALLERFEISARPRDLVGSMRPSQCSMVAIARALADLEPSEQGGDSVLLLDEPTATLAEHEAHELMTALRARADAGQTIVIVSHRFPEVQGIADDVTVFRDGRVAATDRMSAMPIDRLVQTMTGGIALAPSSSVAASAAPHRSAPEGSGDPERSTAAEPTERFAARGLNAGAARDLDLTVAAGEIVGLAGLGGSGRSSLLRAAFGSLPAASGSMLLDGERHHPLTPAAAMAAGVALVPEDRHADAAFLDLSVRENTSITVLDRFWRGLRLSRRAETRSTAGLIDAYSIRTESADAPLGSLSGGNQQKAILARWLQREPRLLLLDEPTQGVDVVARREIYGSIAAAASRGCGVLVASSDLDELLAITHRIVVLRDGRAVADLDTAASSRDEIAHLMMLDRTPYERTAS